ncbi:MAG: flagellar biosynthesis anti-sigma factor FlgM [Pirellula sp.]|jgi:flagellar biosynthesis anti-sigma factor FlgM
MQISNNFSISGVDAVRSASRANGVDASRGATASEAGITAPSDQLDLSPEALAIGNQPSGEVFRADRVAELRQAIAEGNYDTDEMMTKALSKMLERLG